MLADEVAQLSGVIGGVHLRQLVVNITEGLQKKKKKIKCKLGVVKHSQFPR